MDYQTAYQQLTGSTLFQNWKKSHSGVYLSHLYSGLTNDFSLGIWEIGFYHPDHDTITTFVVDKEISKKPEEGIFKKGGVVDELSLSQVTVNQQQALRQYLELYQKKYSRLALLKGFLVLQTLDEQPLWNVSFVTREFTVLNVKIDAANGEVLHDELITVAERK